MNIEGSDVKFRGYGEFGLVPTEEDEEHYPPPVGAPCRHCGEAIEMGDFGTVFADASVMHQECAFRSVAGSLAHLRRECSCYVEGSTEGDPEGMTRREAARAAYLYFRSQPAVLEP